MNSRGRSLPALAGLLTALATAQSVPKAGPVPTLAQAVEVIEANRKGAKPRPLAPGAPLSAEDRQRAKVFQAARKSVVFISAATKEFAITDVRTGRQFDVPPGTGTGFVWDELGHVVTNYHVVTVEDPGGVPRGEAEYLTVTLADGKQYQACVIGKSLACDIAVLHVFAPLRQMVPLGLGASRRLLVGQSLLAIGNPFGLDHTLTSGIVSGLGREMLTAYGTPIKDVIQTDAAINPGNSGGPLLDMSGRLIGMNTAITSTSGSSAGVGFAIPVDTLNRIVPVLIEKGQQGRPELGFEILPPKFTAQLGITQGLVVSSIVPGSFAAQAGLKAWSLAEPSAGGLPPRVLEKGDVILGFQGKPLLNHLHLFVEMEVHPRGEPFELDVLRDGKVVKVIIDPWHENKTPPAKEKAVI